MKNYKSNITPTRDLFVYIYRIASKLHVEGLTATNYTKNKAIQLTSNCVLPNFCKRIINNHSNEIIKELNTY
jgi:hypothetical protein